MRRRRFLRLGVAGTAWVALTGHTPYRQWKVYRQKHLLIGSCRADPSSYPLAGRVAETLVRWLPESSARASRAPDQRRIASLLASDQWQVSVLSRADAADLATGRGRFDAVGSLPLRSMFAMGDHLLVCRDDFPFRHAWLVAATLTENVGEIPGGQPVQDGGAPVPVHPGALAYAAGVKLPPAPGAESSRPEPGHAHTR